MMSKLKCLFFKFLPHPVFLQNKARRDDFCPRNLKNMHMVVDKLMAHSHLKYKGSQLQQYTLHRYPVYIYIYLWLFSDAVYWLKLSVVKGKFEWFGIVSVWLDLIVKIVTCHTCTHNMWFVFRYIIHAGLQYLPWLGAGLSDNGSQHVPPSCAGE